MRWCWFVDGVDAAGLIVVFAEIVPQSVCSRHGLAVGAYSLPFVYAFLVISLPVTWPLAWLLDRLLGREISGVFTRKGLLALIRLNVEDPHHAKESGLTQEDGRLLGGALMYKDRTIGDVMTPLQAVFALPMDTRLDRDTLLSILSEGHTRIPVYVGGDKSKISALVFAKDLLGIGFERSLPLSEVVKCFNGTSRVHRVARGTKLNVALEMCQREHVHMLVVADDSPSDRDVAAVGIVTMEDFLEEILQAEIVDETDVFEDNAQASAGVEMSAPPPSRKSKFATAVRKKQQARSPTSVASVVTLMQKVDHRKLKRMNSKKYETTRLLKQVSETDSGAPRKLFA